MQTSATPPATGTEPVQKLCNGSVIRLQTGDLTALEVDAFVFYAREDLALGSGFGTAIQSRGGDAVRKELGLIGHLGMGEAVLTGAGNLPAGHIIHACGPKFQEAEVATKLRACMRSALGLAARSQFRTLAFPPMGAGFYGVPLDLCAEIMLAEIREFLLEKASLQQIVICVMDRREFVAFRRALEAL